MVDFKSVKALSFDCYGTLIDWENGILRALGPNWSASLLEETVLQGFAKHESAVEEEHPNWRYSKILEEVYRRMAKTFGMPMSDKAAADFGKSVGDWPAFPDTIDALKKLSERYRLYILSNVDMESFARTHARLGTDFAGVFTAEEVGSYKPDHNNFAYLLTRLAEDGVRRHELVHVAQSLYHDVVPASELEIDSVWIDRRKGRGGGATKAPASPLPDVLKFDSLAAFAEAALRR